MSIRSIAKPLREMTGHLYAACLRVVHSLGERHRETAERPSLRRAGAAMGGGPERVRHMFCDPCEEDILDPRRCDACWEADDA
jgi:hypothetical protein